MSSSKLHEMKEAWLEAIRQVSELARKLEADPQLNVKMRARVAAVVTILSEYETRLANASTAVDLAIINKAMAKVVVETSKTISCRSRTPAAHT